MSRIANNLPNNENGLKRYWRASRIRNKYIQNIENRLNQNGYTGARWNLKAPQYVYRYGQIAQGNSNS